MKVKFNQDACIGCGACAATCPDAFDFDDAEGHAVLKNAKAEEGNEEVKVAEVNDANVVAAAENPSISLKSL